MEALIERLEQAVIRLEQVSNKMQACRCVSISHSNGLDGKARCNPTREHKNSTEIRVRYTIGITLTTILLYTTTTRLQ